MEQSWFLRVIVAQHGVQRPQAGHIQNMLGRNGSLASWRHFFLGFDLAAWLNAMATACFGGFPSPVSVLMFALTVLGEYPFFNGMASVPQEMTPTISRNSREIGSSVSSPCWCRWHPSHSTIKSQGLS